MARSLALAWAAGASAVLLAAGLAPAQTTIPAAPPPAPATGGIPANGRSVSGSVISPTAAGWNVTIDSRWLDNPGYRPLRVRVTPTATVVADSQLSVVVTVHPQWYNREAMVLVEQSIDIPAGTAPTNPIDAIIDVPPIPSWCDFSLKIVDPAGPTTVLDAPRMRGANQMNAGWLSTLGLAPHVLVVADRPTGADALAEALPIESRMALGIGEPADPAMSGAGAAGGSPRIVMRGPGMGSVVTMSGGLSIGTSLPTILTLPTSELPRRWLDYSGLDVICLSVERLADVAKKRPEALRAIRRWTAAGGNLWVYDLGGANGPWARMADLERLLEFATSEPKPEGSPSPPGWVRPSKALFGGSTERVFDIGGAESIGPSDVDASQQPTQREMKAVFDQYGNPMKVSGGPVQPPSPPEDPTFLLRECGMGMVAAIRSPDPFTAEAAWSKWDWGWLLDSLGPGRWRWTQRHGVTVGLPNADYWDFLIPGVGLAPVVEFQVLITLFVLGIGPLNYWLLRRKKRLHLMVLTVPASAAAVTLVLFAYALLSDGLGTRVMARSFTRLDQRRGEAVTWARLSYYAGLAPSGGLTFSDQTAVFPISGDDDLWSSTAPTKRMVWDADQRLVQGWLRSRTPTQYLTVRSGPSSIGLQITQVPGSTSLEVENRLGVPIDRLAIRGTDGAYCWVANVGIGATTRANPVAQAEVLSWLGGAATASLPLPTEAARRAYAAPRYRASSPYYYVPGVGNMNALPGYVLTSLMEEYLSRLGSGDAAPGGGTSSPPDGQWKAAVLARGSYVAIVSNSPEVELGTDAAREESSFHVILGNW